MFYYAEIDSEYLVTNIHSLTTASTNENYVAITEEQYNSGDLVGQYYNSLLGIFEIIDMMNYMGNSNWMTHKETQMPLSTKTDNMEAEIHSKADINHTHDGYASSDDLTLLEDVVNTKADATHTHSEYSLSTHSHSEYATQIAFDTLETEVDGKADSAHIHSEYANVSHSHDEYAGIGHSHSNYAETTHEHDNYALDTHAHTASEVGASAIGHNHDDAYADVNHNHDSAYATSGHDHNEDYSTIDHTHADYATVTSLDELSATVSGKANVSHSHNDVYYTEAEIDAKLANKAEASHTHTGIYEASGAAADALTFANAYTDSKIDALVGEGASTTLDTIGEISAAIEDNQDAIDLLNSAIANKANVTDLNSHASDTELHITEAEREAWNAKSNFSGNYNDLTNKPSIPSIDGLATETYVDTQINAINIPSALADLTTDSTHRVVTDAEKTAWNAKSDFSGSYNDLTDKPTIPSISGLATETYVDEAVSAKANSNHNHDSSYDALGTAETKANAVQANLDVVSEDLTEHIDNADIHFTAAERTKLSGISANANNYTHPNSGVTAGTYKSVTVNAQGHITGGTNPTTLAGYGITDAESKGAAASALSLANSYTDTAIDTLSETVATKANASDLTSHTGNTTIHITSTERTNWNAAKTHANSVHAPSNAEENQNAFSNIVVNGTTIAADAKTDTLTFVAGSNITLTPDATGDSITISSANTIYTHPTTAGNKHIPAGGSSGQILRWASDGTAVWGNDNNTTYGVATQTSNGLMSDTDKTKLDGIAEGANNYTLPSAGTSLGGVKSGGDVTIASGVITVNDDSHNHVISNVDGLQSALDAKAASGHNHDSVYYTETEVDTLLSGKAASSHTHSIANVSGLQAALDGKAASSHGTHVAYSTTAPVMDGTASVGSASTVARSDHKHPTDTSRASQTDLDALETVVAGKANSSHTHTIANVTNLQSILDAKYSSTNKPTPADIGAIPVTTITTDIDLNTLKTTGYYMLKSSSNTNAPTTGNAILLVNFSVGTPYQIFMHDATFKPYYRRYTNSSGTWGDWTHTLANSISGNASTATKATQDASGNTITSTYETKSDSSAKLTEAKTYTDEVAEGKANLSHTHTIANVTNLQSSLDAKQATITGGASTITSSNLTANRALISNGTGKVAVSAVTNTELGYLDGVTSNVQTQLDGKAASSHNHAASNITSGTLSSDRLPTVPVSKGGTGATTAAGALTNLGITATATELNYVDGVTSNIQTQLNNKASSSHTHNYAGSSSAGGVATSANKLATSVNIGKASFDGTANIDLHSIAGRANVKSTSNAYANQYTKFARIDVSSGAYTCCSGTLEFCPTEANSVFGELGYYFRTSSTIESTTIMMHWKTLTNISFVDCVSAVKVSNGVYDLYYKPIGNWDTMTITNVNCFNPSKITFYSGQDYVASITAAATSSLQGISNSATSATTAAKLGSSTVGGTAKPIYLNAGTATACSSTVGSATQPVYMNGGTITACTYTLGKSVPSDAKFTDTVYTHPTYTARTGVPTANATLTHGGTFTVTQPVCDATGHITALNTRTYTLPSDNNTDTKVTNTLATTTKAYVTGTTSATTNTGTQVFDTGVYLDTTAGQLTATTFNGTTFSGSGVATVSEVETYLGI